MLDLEGLTLSAEEIELLQHPLTGGVILFSRNYENQSQVQELCSSIRSAASKPLLIAVDQEGGRVQRFRDDFTRIPPMGKFRQLDISDKNRLQSLNDTGWLLAAELIASGVDISFTPVLDIDSGISKVIGDRGFSDDPAQIIEYASALIAGMKQAGMSSTGKHFPGHGSTVADSHFELPDDPRSLEQIRKSDLSVFSVLCQSGLDAIMPAHVIYSDVDPLPACFSHFWLQTILREEINFNGAIFSDDLSMAGAKVIGDIVERAKQALAAGCDMILCCNQRDEVISILDHLPQQTAPEKVNRIHRMLSPASQYSFQQLKSQPRWQRVNKMLREIEG